MSLDHVTYELAWTTSRATSIPHGFSFVAKTGERIDVTHATVTSFEVALEPCRAPVVSPTRTGTMGVLRTLVLPSVAHAGHTDRRDHSALREPRIEALGRPSQSVWGELSFARSRYCGVQYVAARATTPETAGRFDELATLHAEFTIHPVDGSATRSKVAHAVFAAGKRLDFDASVETDPSVAPGSSVVRIERDLDAAFRDVDFTLSGREFERACLRGLAETTRIRVRIGRPGAP